MRIGLLLLCLASLAVSQPFHDKLGIEIDGIGDGSRARPFVNHAKIFRPCTQPNTSTAVQIDGEGWPLSDAQCVMFDIRPTFAWAPPIDDPAQFQPDWSGDWAFSFDGQAEISISSGGARFSGLTYDATRNTTSGTLTVNSGTGLLILIFNNTKRLPSSPSGSGFRNLRLIRPGYSSTSNQIFTDEFLRSFQPFRTLRYMDFTHTNSVTPSATVEDRLEWQDRRLPNDATQQSTGRKVGVAWDYAILLANQTGTDLWINIPVSASDTYIRRLAELISSRLNPGLRIYIEHGNEVWNRLFSNSYNYNRNAALSEFPGVQATTDVLSLRRHARRVMDSVKIFREVMGRNEAPGDFDNWRIRGIFAWWTIVPDQYRQALNWMRDTHGPPNQYFYALANTHYYNITTARPTDSPEQLVEAMRVSSERGLTNDNTLRQIANDFGIRHTIYEGGPDVGGGSTTNLSNRILANRLPAMSDLLKFDMKDNWWDRGGAEYMYFSHIGPYSRFGCWGAAEDVANLDTPKWRTLVELSGKPFTPSIGAFVNGGSFAQRLSPGGFSSLFGDNLSRHTHQWDEAILDGRTLPTMLGGVQIRIAGKPVAISYASKSQVNFVIPPDLTLGPADVEVHTPFGTTRSSITLQRAAPGWFGNLSNGRIHVGEPTRTGGIVALFATGLGPTATALPVNEAPQRPYPVQNPSDIRVTIAGMPAQVLFAGVTYAGVYQINIQVPSGIVAGEHPITLTAGEESAQPAFLTVIN